MPYYQEFDRTVEERTECILFLHVQNDRGAPEPGLTCRLWGGPPPSGEPPYFVDDDPDNPNRRTDGAGKFQFIVSGGAVPDRTDLFVQVFDSAGAPASDPVQFTFLPEQPTWIRVTLAMIPEPEAEAGSDSELEPPPSIPELEGEASPGGWMTVSVSPPPTEPEEIPPTPSFPIVESLYTNGEKGLTHYVLFGAPGAPGTMTNLILALDYLVHFAPAAGFKLEEAVHAQRVTIVGDERSVSAETEGRLRSAGCSVIRLAATDSYKLEQLLQDRIASNVP